MYSFGKKRNILKNPLNLSIDIPVEDRRNRRLSEKNTQNASLILAKQITLGEIEINKTISSCQNKQRNFIKATVLNPENINGEVVESIFSKPRWKQKPEKIKTGIGKLVKKRS